MDWSTHSRRVVRPDTLVDLLRERASNLPDELAFTHLEDGDKISGTLTFAQLDQKARHLAAHLQARTQAHDRVLLVYPSGLDYAVAFFACAYAGVIAVPALPPTTARTFPRLQGIARDAKPRIALAQAAIVGQMRQLQQDAERSEDDALLDDMTWLCSAELGDAPTPWRRPELQPSDTVFLQYTSGSTGTPKGAMVSNQNILANLGQMSAAHPVRPGEAMVSWLPPHHDMGLIGMILYAVYAAGHCVQFPPAAFLMRPYRWLKAISDYRAVFTAAPNFAYDQCIDRVTDEQKRTLDLSSMLTFLNGAEPVRPETLQRFAASFSACGLRPDALTPGYGMAEATLMISSSGCRRLPGRPPLLSVSKEHLAAGSIVPERTDGRCIELVSTGLAALNGHHVRIVDPQTLEELPDDRVGEIWAHGPSVTQGYWNRPEETQRIFAATIAGERTCYLRTGDLGFIHDGELYISGRIKDLMIFNGRNVYPQDVEKTIEAVDPGFRTNGCAVFSVQEGARTRLVIVQELEARRKVTLAAVMPRLRAEIAEQHEIFDVAAMLLVKAGKVPRTSSGKLQRSRCKELFLAEALVAIDAWKNEVTPGEGDDGVVAYSETQRQIAQIWQELLGVERISPRDNFFSLGGHSLLATQFISRVRAQFQIELSLLTLFEAPTIEAVARVIDQAGERTPVAAMLPMPRDAAMPLSFAQQRLWFLDRLDPAASLAYHLPISLRLQGSLDRAALRSALNALIRRHESLRTRIVAVDGQPMQVIASAEGGLDLREHDLRAMDAVQQHDAVACIRREEAIAPFDLATGPLIRVRLLQLSDGEHVLLLTQHHITSDGWSTGVLLRELGALYGACAQHEADPLPALPIQYADYAAWQHQCLQADTLRTQIDFWHSHLQGAPALLELPADRARPAVQSYRGRRLPLTLDAELTAALRRLAQRHGVTPFMVLLGAWSALLSRLSGQTDLVIGTPVANRPRAELEPLIGFFVNTLALRVRVEPDLSVEQLLAQLKTTTLAAYAHQDVPFDHVVEALKPARNLGYSPIFQVMLTLDNTPDRGAPTWHGLSVSASETERDTTQFDLSLSLTPAGDALAGHIEYATDLFDAATVARYAGHFATLLAGMIAQDRQSISRLPLLGEAERQQLLRQFNATAVEYRQDQLIHQLFETQVAETPDAIALVCERASLSYIALNRRANQLAHHLLAQGIKPDDRVAVCLERGVEMVVGLLAILKAGGAYVPLDPAYPAERLAYMLGDSAPVAVLTQQSLAVRLRELDGATSMPLLVLDSPDSIAMLARHPDRNPDSQALGLHCGHLAYVIYTSGSTGLPKGVMNQHNGVLNFLRWNHAQYPLGPDDHVLQKTPFSFDVSVWEFFVTLTTGARLVIARPDGHQDPQYLGTIVGDEQITLLHFVPSMLQIFLDYADLRQCASLRRVLCIGEALPPALQERFLRLLPHVELHNLYGPTEAAVHVTFWRCDPALHVGKVPMGRPIANTQLYVLDAHRQPVPMGVAGEIFIGGASVARGYLNRPELTAARFGADPFSGRDDARLYQTGDLGRWLPDGTVEYLGRNDFQVKIRGFRIELGEIETRLSDCAGVHEAVVVAREDSIGGKQLVAYLIPTATPPSIADLRAELVEMLPEYMLPAAFVVLDAWPLTANGKLDRKALPAPDHTSVVTRAYAPPSGETEIAIAEIWQGLLDLQQIGRDDNFFELGGHSLLAIQVLSRVHARFGNELALRALFEAPTVAKLSQRVRASNVSAGRTMLAVDRRRLLPLSFAQQRMWFVQEMEGASTTYNMPLSLRLTGPLDVDAFRAALQALVDRHEILRSSFVADVGDVHVRIAPTLQIPLPVIELTPADVAAHERAHADHVFRLADGPLLIAKLLRLDAGEHVLLLNVHHIVCDGWSLRILVGEWLRLYDALRQTQPSSLPALSLQYADYAHWQRESLQADLLDDQLAYWTQQLSGAPELLNLPTDRPRPPVQRFDSGSETRVIGKDLTQRVVRLGHEVGASVFMTLVSVFALLLSRQSGEKDLLIGTPLVNRNRQELEGLIGLFLGNLVLRADLSGQLSFRELLLRMRQTALDAYSNSELPFERIVDALPLKRDLSRNPLFQVFFNMLDLPELAYQSSALDIELMDGAQFDAKFDLTVYAEQTAAGLKLHLVYNRALFDAERMQEWLRQFEGLLEQIVAAPDRSIDDYSLLTAQAAVALPDPVTALDRTWIGSVPELFAQRCAAHPDAPAVACHERRWSYRELDEHSERIACWLQDHDVQPGEVVAILATRNAILVAAVLGVLKAGAVFMILDPAYPSAHLQACLEAAPPKAWLQIANESTVDPSDVLWPGMACLDLRDLDANVECSRRDRRRARPVAISADDIALIAFTSGSSGKPKAVQSRHGPLTRFYPWLQEHFGLGAQDRFSLLSGLAHDPLQRDIFNALYLGASLHIPAADIISSGRLAQWMADSGVTVSHLTPAMAQLLCDAPVEKPLSRLRRAFLIGDVLTRRDVQRLQALAPEAQIVNTYGATETQRALSYYEISRESAAQRLRQVIPLGQGMPGVQLLVLTAAGHRAGVGELGEVYIRSHHLARGYLDDPALTCERFLLNPFTGSAGDRMYRTGDLGRYLPNGMVECLGRSDHQVKVRGFRIELGHIEALLGQHPDIREAIAMVREDGERGRLLVAYVTVRDRRPNTADLRSYLQSKLPDYMQPTTYVFLDALPLTPNGKVHRQALPMPDGHGSCVAYLPARTATEITLTGIWSEVLKSERIGVLDNFFELGGHSLLATQVVSRIRSEFDVDLPLRTLFEVPTVAALSAAIDRRLADLEEIEL